MTSWIIIIPDHLKTQDTCNEAVTIEPRSLAFVPDRFESQEICNEAVRNKPCMMLFVPDHLCMQEMCNEAVRIEPLSLSYIPDHFKTQDICDKAVKDDSTSLQFVPDWFVTWEGIDMWYDDYYGDNGGHWDVDDNEDNFFEWCDGYKKQKAQKAQIKKELLPIAWHPSRYWDWCMSEDEKKETERL